MAEKQEKTNIPSRERIHELARPFLTVKGQRDDLFPLLPSLRDKSRNDVVRVVRGDRSRTKQDFANEISAALQFPQDFLGRSWDAFDEFINDLDWLPATNGYLLIITDADQLLSKEPFKDLEILMDIFKKTAKNWESGANHDMLVRAYQEEVVPNKSSFAIVLQISPDADLSGNFGSWLEEVDVPKMVSQAKR